MSKQRYSTFQWFKQQVQAEVLLVRTESSRLPLAARERETKREPSEKEREEGGVDKLVGRETNTQKERNNFDGVKKT